MTSRSYKFERKVTNRQVLKASGESPAKKPDWWTAAWRTLPQKIYRLDGLLDSNCLTLTTDVTQLILPASEVFRVFCAPEPLLADTLLSGPWDVVRHKVLNESWSGRSDDQWELGLRAGLTNRSAISIAAFEMTDLGRGVAGFIYTNLIGGRDQNKRLYADIPYDWDEMEIDVQGIPFPADNKKQTGLDRFLGLRIIGVRFPKSLQGFPSRLIYRLDNYNTLRSSPDDVEVNTKLIPIYKAPLSNDISGTVLVTPSEEASSLSEPVVLGQQSTEVVGGPVVERMELNAPDNKEHSRTTKFNGGYLHAASATPTRHSSSDASPLHPTADIDHRTGNSFNELTKALDALVRDQVILNWKPVAPVDDKFEFRYGLPVWLFPVWKDNRRKAWAYISGSQRRSALVVRINMSTETFYLVEIERRFWGDGLPREAFSLFLLKSSDASIQKLISLLLSEGVETDGVWLKTVKASSIEPLLGNYLIRQHPSTKGLPKDTLRQKAWNSGLLAIFKRFITI